MLRLALPVVLTYLGFMTMNLVDLVCVGRIDAAAIGAVGVGTSIFSWFMIFGIGLLHGLDFLIAHAFGAGRKDDCHVAWSQGIWISLILGIPMTGALLYLSENLGLLGINAEIIPPSRDYLWVLSFSLIPVYLFTASRQLLQAMGIVRPALVILILANLLNAAANWALVLGYWGFPAMGVKGSAQATLIARVFMLAALFAYHLHWDFKNEGMLKRIGIPFVRETMKKLLRLGTPSALQMTFEVGVFALTTTLAAKLTAEALAAHQIVLNIASLSFMVPLGVGSATAVLVGQELGRRDPALASKMGWKGITLGTGFMTLSAVAFIVFSTLIVEFYTNDPGVIGLARNILIVAALFQLSDGAQVSATGALRGLADTRTPMLANLIGHWGMGLPLGVYLCFYRQQGLQGLWIGLSLGLTVVALTLIWRWMSLSRSFIRDPSRLPAVESTSVSALTH